MVKNEKDFESKIRALERQVGDDDEEDELGSQSQDAGVRAGWKVLSVEGEMVKNEKDFESKIRALERQVGDDDEEDEFGNKKEKKGKGKGKGKGKEEEPAERKMIKYDYAIVFEILPGTDETSSEEE